MFNVSKNVLNVRVGKAIDSIIEIIDDFEIKESSVVCNQYR